MELARFAKSMGDDPPWKAAATVRAVGSFDTVEMGFAPCNNGFDLFENYGKWPTHLRKP
jgi:hypothetical protein